MRLGELLVAARVCQKTRELWLKSGGGLGEAHTKRRRGVLDMQRRIMLHRGGGGDGQGIQAELPVQAAESATVWRICPREDRRHGPREQRPCRDILEAYLTHSPSPPIFSEAKLTLQRLSRAQSTIRHYASLPRRPRSRARASDIPHPPRSPPVPRIRPAWFSSDHIRERPDHPIATNPARLIPRLLHRSDHVPLDPLFRA